MEGRQSRPPAAASKKRVSRRGSQKKKKRIGHIYEGSRLLRAVEGWDSLPRGWIDPEGRFIRTKYHWATIAEQLDDDAEAGGPEERGERNAHRAYSAGWISIGHGGVLNAIGHESTWKTVNHPAVATLRKLLSKIPQLAFRVEKQIGRLDPQSGRHVDFDVTEYDLDFFIRRGKLRRA